MKSLLLIIAILGFSINSIAQSPITPVKEIKIYGEIQFSKTSSSEDPSTGTVTHKFTCKKDETKVCLTINKPALPTGETIEVEQLPSGVIDVGILITIETPTIPSNPIYYGYFSSYAYALDPLNSLEAEHTFVLVNP